MTVKQPIGIKASQLFPWRCRISRLNRLVKRQSRVVPKTGSRGATQARFRWMPELQLRLALPTRGAAERDSRATDFASFTAPLSADIACQKYPSRLFLPLRLLRVH